MTNLKNKEYTTPCIEVLEVEIEGVLLSSSDGGADAEEITQADNNWFD